MGEKKVKPPKLPGGAPKELKDFIVCKVMEVDLDPAQAGWIPKPELVPEGLAPTVTPTANGANAVSVAVGWGFVSLTLPVSVVGGQLQVDAANMPGKQAIDDWVKSFNDSLKSNGKELSGLEIKNGKIHLTKHAIAAAVQETPPATTLAPPIAPITPTPTDATPPATEGEEKADLKPGCLIGIILVMVLVIGAAVVRLAGSNGSKSPDAQATTSSQRPTTTLKPIDEKEICANLAIVEQVLAEFGTDDPCTIDPDDFWDACDASFMPCFKGPLPLIVLSPAVGITHGGSVPDAATGQTGPSQAEHSVTVVGPVSDDAATIDVISQCGDDTLTGQSPLSPTGVTSIKHPLLSFGGCTAQVNYRTASERRVIGTYEYTVSEVPVAAGQPITTGVTVPAKNTLDAAGTTLGLLGGKPLDLNCTWFNAQGYPLGFAGCPSDHWSFNAAYNDPRIASYGAGFVNPLGIAAPTAEQIAPFGASRLFGPGTYFPCGRGELGYTACAKNEATVESSAFVAGTVSFTSRLDDIAVGTYVEVGVKDYWLRLLRKANAWELTSSEGDDSQGRAILRGNAVTFMIPYDEPATLDLAYTVTVGDDAGEVAQAPQPILGVVTSTQGPETPADFFRQLSTSIATGDLTYALDRLHPLVYQAFPGDVCRSELSLRVAPDYAITVDSVGETAPWTWELPDGRSYEFEEATTATIRLPGIADPVDSHLVSIDKVYYWFTVCDGR